MLTPHRAQDGHASGSSPPVWLTLYGPGEPPPPSSSFGAFERLEEGHFPPRARLRERLLAAEVLTYVRAGALLYEDSTGSIGVIRAGEFQRTSLSPGSHYNEVNASSYNWAHAFQFWLAASESLRPGYERRRFSLAERRGRLCPVASPDARCGSLRLEQDVVVYSAILGRGQHVVHVPGANRNGWLHIVAGAVRIAPMLELEAGDGLSIIDEPIVSATAQQNTELLLVDVARTPQVGAEVPTDRRTPSDLN